MVEAQPGDGEPARSREQSVSDTFVMLADTLIDDYDVIDLLHSLVNACVELLGVTSAGILLKGPSGDLSVIAASNEAAWLLEVCQLDSDQGPCLDCVRTGAVVVTGDLQADPGCWPGFAAVAQAAGFRSVVAVPLRLREQTIGGMNLFSSSAEPMPEVDRRLAQALADVATIGVLQQRLTQRTAALAEQLQHALDSRVLVEQAKGILAERNGVNMDVAFAGLRRYARNNNLKLAGVAQSVVQGALDPGNLREPADAPMHKS